MMLYIHYQLAYIYILTHHIYTIINIYIIHTGPVHTQFGWHLILIHERDEQRTLIEE
jgi:S-ribosylhomocysteine lyase LuxS involved in autoinducer biosynthesis